MAHEAELRGTQDKVGRLIFVGRGTSDASLNTVFVLLMSEINNHRVWNKERSTNFFKINCGAMIIRSPRVN